MMAQVSARLSSRMTRWNTPVLLRQTIPEALLVLLSRASASMSFCTRPLINAALLRSRASVTPRLRPVAFGDFSDAEPVENGQYVPLYTFLPFLIPFLFVTLDSGGGYLSDLGSDIQQRKKSQ